MKRPKRYFGLLSMMLCVVLMCSMTSCIRKKQDQGKKVTQSIKVTDFHRIKVSGNAAVVCRTGAVASVKVSGYEADLKQVKVTVEDGCLEVNQSSTWESRPGSLFSSFSNTATIYVTVPQLDGCQVEGNADVRIEDKMTAPRFALVVFGNASCDMKALQSDSLSVQISGNASANVHAAAVAKYARVSSAGNSDVQILLDHAGNVDADATGNSSVTLTGTLTGKVQSEVAGNADINNQTTQVKPIK